LKIRIKILLIFLLTLGQMIKVFWFFFSKKNCFFASLPCFVTMLLNYVSINVTKHGTLAKGIAMPQAKRVLPMLLLPAFALPALGQTTATTTKPPSRPAQMVRKR
jgi:hypothetical protein